MHMLLAKQECVPVAFPVMDEMEKGEHECGPAILLARCSYRIVVSLMVLLALDPSLPSSCWTSVILEAGEPSHSTVVSQGNGLIYLPWLYVELS
eukprot:scaffold3521_cov20-Tisochrysis_lutea.AAC.2